MSLLLEVLKEPDEFIVLIISVLRVGSVSILINLINPHLKQNKEVNKRALIVGSLCSTMVIAFIGIGIGAATNTRDAPVILNGVTYIKNNSNGYTIAAYDFESNSLTLEDSIDGLPVNEINPTLFANSDFKAYSPFAWIPNSSSVLLPFNSTEFICGLFNNAV